METVDKRNKQVFISVSLVTTLASVCRELFKLGVFTYPDSIPRIFSKPTISSTKTFNTTDTDCITYDESNGTILHKGKEIKLGKLLSATTLLNSTEIEQVVSYWKSMYEVDTSTVLISDEVSTVYDYNNVGGSCMAGHGEYMKIYEDVGTKIAYILVDDRLVARCLYWDYNIYKTEEDETLCSAYDRIFFTKEKYKLTLEKYFKDRGIPYIKDSTYITSKNTSDCYDDGVPYIDSMYYLTDDYRLTNDNELGGYMDTFQQTNGASDDSSGISGKESGIYCNDIGSYENEDEVYYCETDNEYYYYLDDLTYIEGHGYYRIDDDNIVHCEDIQEYNFIDNSYYCEHSSEYYYESSSVIELYTGGYICTEYIDYTTYCADIDAYVYEDVATYYVENLEEYYYDSDDLVEVDGKYYTKEYYEQHKEELQDENS